MLPARLKPIESAYQRFRRDSEILSQLLAQPLTDQSARALKRTMFAWRRDLEDYYRRVEPLSFALEISTRAPYLRRQLEGWQRKHTRLMRQLEQICQQLRRRPLAWDATQSQLQMLVHEILQHEQERDLLAWDAYYPEPAALD
ncbi:MAG: hypothetical protein RMI91_10650 [Gemmatales bacterium]|nr:hypothetical protein [Gemmatales bacterium]MDW7995102.1 hypothetical protein [Gemmatales bacterium]